MSRPAASHPTLSVVVPVYNVAAYLTECLESIRAQHVDDLEIVAVDDGSTDDSPAILAEAAARDPRIRIVTQTNQGLGAARNTGVDHATGEYLWFVDSDDRLVPGAMAMMLATITTTGSDLVTGNVARLIGDDQAPTRFLAETFARTRMRTHIRRFPLLINDRVAWNKVYRRSFWDRHLFRFPSGVHYEDQYVTLPAHYLAKRVDVRHEPVYLWRVREDGETASITQQRTDPQSMRDRVKAVAYVSRFLADHGRRHDKLRYDESAVTHDLRYFLDVFDTADQDYREAFLGAANGYLERVDGAAFARLPTLRRLQWDAVRRGDAEQAAELVRFEHEDLAQVRASRSGRRWYADYPGRNETSNGVADSRFAVRRELRLISTIDALEIDATVVRVRGHAAIDLVGHVSRRLQLLALPQGRGRPHVFRVALADAGSYVAELPLARLRPAGRDGEWRLVLIARDHGLRRVAVWHEVGASRSAERVITSGAGVAEVRLALTGRGLLTLATTSTPATVQQVLVDGGVLELSGRTGRPLSEGHLVVAGHADPAPLHVEPASPGSAFLARLPLGDISRAATEGGRIEIVTGGVRRGLVYSGEDVTVAVGPAKLRVGRSAGGYLTVSTAAG